MHLLERTARWMPDVWIAGPNRQHPWPLVSDRTFAIGDWRLTRLRNQLRSPTAMLIKRLLDLCVAVLAGGLALPGMLAIAAAVRLSSSGPALYGQQRIGRGGKVFRLWKFRTMFSDAEEVLEEYLERHPDLKEQWERDRKLSSDPRVVPYIGWFLRKTSLDELPQLWNVIRGEMSLVGPRPLPAYHLAQFEPSFCAYRAEVTPGITGLWQVSSRGRGEAEAYVRCDTQYIRTWSIWLDVRILLGTFGAVVSGRGAS
jgi:lipopolysaccharide/colanic/teichoic acid biosynthesis glycosyltransferase